ncbi:hypothetical protein [Burkholderia stagnalis]|uniref:Alpha/beta hydrolase n=1 Tax=Burkholderia stagnalis TaxID=1503054 RepID=A0A125JBI2_9BURK|nr:hypothetical protein [Burkholderia stagnalis]KVZ02609.1 hypothetical protein WT35_31470 [Burkholderia stagnalis]KWA53724.1 hypothetical protein WT42_15440 [Burkholderia stagnalis]KWA58838.1 hypothetical protein WT44_22075 [Burkholderia stagnalis]KWA60725.1 hypothetical protein WT43_15290 [Burkholderia stagnalis]KWC97601.1 hypothetical protein WT46_26155 [Burkholderia stagnalis]
MATPETEPPLTTGCPVDPKARRRVSLQFDDQTGDPYFESVTSPTNFKMRALCVLPPRHVIPVIFVPGIMGSNLCSNGTDADDGTAAWRPPNGKIRGLGELWRRANQTPAERQKQMKPESVRVDTGGKISIPRSLYTITEKEARKRGWGEVHLDSYGHVLAELEIALNEQYLDAGTKDHTLMPVWEIAKTLRRREGNHASGKDVDVVDKDWHPVNTTVPPLGSQEFSRLDDYFFPVWACGYNWLKSNEESAQELIARIHTALDYYKRGNYWISTDKVIVVTHSMGGLVTRRAAQDLQETILGVVHGVQPVGGAPVVYRRLRAGTETNGWFDLQGMALAAVFGWSAADITCVMANSPGPLELLPTKQYPGGWLRFVQERGGQSKEVMPRLPNADPYLEIYSKRAQEVWWGMVDEMLIDPANKTPKGMEPYGQYMVTLGAAEKFHDTVKLDCHPVTYAHYGYDARQISFGRIVWKTSDEIRPGSDLGSDIASLLSNAKAASFNELGKSTVQLGDSNIRFRLENHQEPTEYDMANAGDGTVPSQSGALIEKGSPAPKVFRMDGFDHAASYKNENVLNNVMYCIAKIVQLAPAISADASGGAPA